MKTNKIEIVVICLWTLIGLIGCNKSNKNVLGKLSDYIKKEMSNIDIRNDSCQIDLNNVTDFKWDKLFVFPEWSMPEDIKGAIGLQKYDGEYVKDDTKRLVFTMNNLIVYEEDYSVNSKKVNFSFAIIDISHQILEFENSKFYIEKDSQSALYLLYPCTP